MDRVNEHRKRIERTRELSAIIEDGAARPDDRIRATVELNQLAMILASDLETARAELAAIQAAWEAEYSQGGVEPEPALTSMLQALCMLRKHKTEMTTGFNTLIEQRNAERAKLAKLVAIVVEYQDARRAFDIATEAQPKPLNYDAICLRGAIADEQIMLLDLATLSPISS